MPEPIAIGLSFTETRRLFAVLAFAAERRRDFPANGADSGLGRPIAVAEALVSIGGITDAVVLCAALLHDVLDHTDTPAPLLQSRFGREIADVVLDVSDDRSLAPEVRRRVQLANAANLSGRARLVRLADMLCRLRALALHPRAERAAEAEWAQAMVARLSGSNAALETAAEAAISALREAP